MAPPHLLTISSVKEPTKNISIVHIFGPLCYQVCWGIIFVTKVMPCFLWFPKSVATITKNTLLCNFTSLISSFVWHKFFIFLSLKGRSFQSLVHVLENENK